MSIGKRRAAMPAALLAAAFGAVHLLFLVLPDVLGSWNARTVDRLFVWRADMARFRHVPDARVVTVNIDDQTIRSFEGLPLGRSEFARVVRNLSASGVAAQAYDFVFAARTDASADSALTDATSTAGNVYLGIALQGVAPMPPAERAGLEQAAWHVRTTSDDRRPAVRSALMPFATLGSRARGLGFLNAVPDSDGVFRRVPLLIPIGGGAYAPSLAFRTACDYLGVDPANILLDPGRSITLKGATPTGQPPRDIVIPTDREGNLILDFAGPWEALPRKAFEIVWAASNDRDVLSILRDELSGRIAVVADISTGVADVGPIPTDPQYPLAGIHLTALSGILAQSFLRQAPPALGLAADVLLLLLLLMAATIVRTWRFLIVAAALIAVSVAVWAWSFLAAGIILNIVRPVLIVAIGSTAITAHRQIVEARDRAVLRQSFEAYFSPAWVERLVRNPTAITEAVQKKELTILFSDIKDFTSRSSTMDPEDLRRFLNEYFGAMVDVAFAFGGTVDKFIGDGLMIFFGDPEEQPDHAQRAVDCAMEMQRRVRALNAAHGGHREPIRIRIGVNSGVVVVGNMGSARRLSYTALGANVNLAQRLESNAPPGGILLSASTRAQISAAIATVPRESVMVKGLTDPIPAYEIPADRFAPGGMVV